MRDTIFYTKHAFYAKCIVIFLVLVFQSIRAFNDLIDLRRHKSPFYSTNRRCWYYSILPNNNRNGLFYIR